MASIVPLLLLQMKGRKSLKAQAASIQSLNTDFLNADQACKIVFPQAHERFFNAMPRRVGQRQRQGDRKGDVLEDGHFWKNGYEHLLCRPAVNIHSVRQVTISGVVDDFVPSIAHVDNYIAANTENAKTSRPR